MSKRGIFVSGPIAIVPLTQGYLALIDAEDVPLVEGYSWTALVKANTIYAKRAQKVDGRSVTVRMHRVIAGANADQIVDHINGNGWDNRRCNLRIATNAENLRNRGPQKNNTSGYKGVTWSKAAKKWQAQIKTNGAVKYLGLFDSKESANAAREAASKKDHGEFAWGAENGVVFHDQVAA